MAHLTVTEKEHWKERISLRIEKALEAIWAEDANLKARINREARQLALDSLGLAELDHELEHIQSSIKTLEQSARDTRREMLATVRGVKPSELGDRHHSYHRTPSEVENAIDRRKKVHEQHLLSKDGRGKRILSLQTEKEELLDTVWLATSGNQIKELWQKVADVLDQHPTPLQKKALTIEPPKDGKP